MEILKNEIWKDCLHYEGLYQVSNLGRVWSVKRQIVLKHRKRKDGYITVALTGKNGKVKTEYVHRLVALTFIENVNNLPFVNHINEIKSDNRVINLEWITHRDNLNHGTAQQRKAISIQNKVSKRNKDTSGFRGIYKRGEKFRVQIKCNSKTKYIGTYTTLDKAIEARKQAEIKYYGSLLKNA